MMMMMTTMMMQQRESKPHQSLSPLSSFIYIQSAISVLFHHQHHQHHHRCHHHHQNVAVCDKHSCFQTPTVNENLQDNVEKVQKQYLVFKMQFLPNMQNLFGCRSISTYLSKISKVFSAMMNDMERDEKEATIWPNRTINE